MITAVTQCPSLHSQNYPSRRVIGFQAGHDSEVIGHRRKEREGRAKEREKKERLEMLEKWWQQPNCSVHQWGFCETDMKSPAVYQGPPGALRWLSLGMGPEHSVPV